MTPGGEEISAGQTADLLNMSRRYLDELHESGDIPSRIVDGRRLLRRSDVVRFRDLDQARRLDAANALAAEAQEYVLVHVEGEAGAGVAEAFGDPLHRDSGLQQQGGVGVPQVVLIPMSG